MNEFIEGKNPNFSDQYPENTQIYVPLFQLESKPRNFLSISQLEIENRGIFMTNVPYLYVFKPEYHIATNHVWKAS